MPVLTTHQIRKRLSALPRWKKVRARISRTFTFSGFQDCITFVNAVAQCAIAADHHPDIDIRFNMAKIQLTTHDEDGLTEMDFRLATVIDNLPAGRPKS